MGGAMDLVNGAKRVVVCMLHCSKDGESKVLPACTLPLTGTGCVNRIVTDLCVADVVPGEGLLIRELAPGHGREEISQKTLARHRFAPDVTTIAF